jgi:hypothetical protein
VHPNKQRPKHGVMASDKNFFFDKGIYWFQATLHQYDTMELEVIRT